MVKLLYIRIKGNDTMAVQKYTAKNGKQLWYYSVRYTIGQVNENEKSKRDLRHKEKQKKQKPTF